jgi:predicted ribosomally synthesized peptide with nif11-like leader
MENAALFMNKLAQDQQMQAALMVAAQSAVTKEEKISVTAKFAQEAGFDVSTHELQKFVESIQKAEVQLSDEELDNVAGGLGYHAATDIVQLVDLKFKPDDNDSVIHLEYNSVVTHLFKGW